MTVETNLYKIGAASKITGINIATLRVWENRYGVVEPIRINGTQRGFTKKDVDRLSMIKQLVDLGDSISTLAKLSFEELELRMQPSFKNSQKNIEDDKGIIKAVSVGTRIPEVGRPSSHLAEVRMVARYELATIMNDLPSIKIDVDIIIFEIASLHSDTVELISDILTKSDTSHALLIYRFGSLNGLKLAQLDGRIHPMQAPVFPSDIQIACNFAVNRTFGSNKSKNDSQENLEHVPFSEKELWEINIMSNPIHCECPKHLSSIISSLRGFEKYSSDCKDLNEKDRVLHKELEAIAAKARTIVELALRKVIKENAISYSTANPS
ncbi:MAG: MerR family transcriptional regulator [Nitrospina sp.]|nr:MerR family transcriptional regulator [Nitrospina sp.]